MTVDTKASEPLTGNYFVSNYPPFSYWSESEAVRYETLLKQPAADADGFGLYVHIPFCVERCQYCYYLSYDGRPEEMARYVRALAKELRLYAESAAFAGREPAFVYFGGGTPSLLPAPLLQTLFRELQDCFSWRCVREATIECAPRSVTEKKLILLREAGVTRISLGAQQLDDAVLEKNGRVHLTADVERACEMILRAGFPVFNVDLITGLVGETDESFRNSLERLIKIAPDSVTIYQLEIPFNTPLHRALREGRLAGPPADWEVKRARLARGFDMLESAGYTVRSGYTAVRDPVRHAFLYQDEQYRGVDLLGIGVSSFSYLRGMNQQNLAALEPYMDALSKGNLPLGRAYSLSTEERMVREFVLQLKLGAVRLDCFREKFGMDPQQRFAEPLARLAQSGVLLQDGDELRLTREGLLRVDHLLREFYLPKHRE